MVQENLVAKTREIHKTPYLEVYRDDNRNIIIYKWKGRVNDADGKEGMLKVLDLIKKFNTKDLIADLTTFMGGSVAIGKWVNDEWSQMLFDAGLKNVAVKLPESAFGGFSNTVALGVKFVSLINVEKFISINDAYHWIEKTNNTK